MKWFRSNLKTGSRLALVALALQFALSFGHFHGLAAQPSQSGLAQSEGSYASVLSQAEATIKTTTRQPTSDHDSGQSPADVCAICATVALANTVLFATLPALPLPIAYAELAYQVIETGLVDLNSARLAFRPRGPPIS